jgi:hypothetical protein
MLISFNAAAVDGIKLTFLDGSTRSYTMEQLKAFNDISKDLQPKILPVITGTMGVIFGGVAASAAGATMPVVVLAATIDGVIYYFYGYGITRFFDEYALDIAYRSRLAEIKAQAYHLGEYSKDAVSNLNQKALVMMGR